MKYKYQDVMPVEPFLSTVWLITEKSRRGEEKYLTIWHKDARIEDVVNAHKTMHPNLRFTVMAFDVGLVKISKIIHSMHNARAVNQDFEMEIE